MTMFQICGSCRIVSKQCMYYFFTQASLRVVFAANSNPVSLFVALLSRGVKTSNVLLFQTSLATSCLWRKIKHCLSICFSFYQSEPVCLCLCVYLFVCWSVYLFLSSLISDCISLCLFVSVCPWLCLFVFVCVWLSLCESVCLCVCLFLSVPEYADRNIVLTIAMEAETLCGNSGIQIQLSPDAAQHQLNVNRIRFNVSDICCGIELICSRL